MIDNLGDSPPTMHMTPEERIEHDAAELRFRALHPDCESHRWTMSGSRATHCGLCCPPLPLSQDQLDELARILDGVRERRADELDVWECRLTCAHLIQKRVQSNRALAAPHNGAPTAK